MYIKFDKSDTQKILRALDKLLKCDPTHSIKVKYIPIELKNLCTELKHQFETMGYIEYRIDYLRPLRDVVHLFGPFFNFSLEKTIHLAICRHSEYVNNRRPIKYYTSEGIPLVYANE